MSPGRFSWGVSALGVALFLFIARLLAPDLFLQVFQPVFRHAETVSDASHSFFSRFGERSALLLENERLQVENAALALENLGMRQKLDNLTTLLSTPLLEKAKRVQVVADVVARPPVSPYDSLLLSVGEQEGVIIGMEAFAASPGQRESTGVPIGVVSWVSESFSRVTLFSSPGFETAAWVGPTELPLTLLGVGGGALRASIARSAGVNVGDVVFVSGPGLQAIGKVTRVDSDSSSPSAVLRITPSLNIFSISTVVLRDMGASLADSFKAASTTRP